jgi:hypothetical protein
MPAKGGKFSVADNYDIYAVSTSTQEKIARQTGMVTGKKQFFVKNGFPPCIIYNF